MTALIIFAVLSVIFWILPERLKKDIEVALKYILLVKSRPMN